MLLMFGSFYLVGRLAVKFGDGHNALQKILSFWPYFTVDIALVLFLAKLVFFRKDRLSDIFSPWKEIKDLIS